MRTPKTKEVKVIQSQFCSTWDDEAVYDRSEYTQIKKDLEEYHYSNPGVPFRVITRRVPV